MSESSVHFDETTVHTKNGLRRALVIMPVGAITLGVDRLRAMERGEHWSALDHLVLHTARTWPRAIQGMIFRAKGPSPGDVWQFGDDLDDEMATQLAARLLRTHVLMVKELAPQGMHSMFGVDFGAREQVAHERGLELVADQLAREMDRAEPALRPLLRLDQWLVERQATWTAMTYQEFVATKLEALMVSGERQYRQLQRMVGRLPTQPL
jgi:hypothetical protein